MNKNGLLLIAALTALVAPLSGCVVSPVDPYYSQPVRLPPPPPRHEYQGYPPAPEFIWISGYWGWGGARYEWIPGRWEAPRPGYLWMPHRWERDGDHWRQSGGRWEQDHRLRPIAPPVVVQPVAPHREHEAPHYRESGDPRAYRNAPPPADSRPVMPAQGSVPQRYEPQGSPRPTTAPPPAYRTAPAAVPAPAPGVTQGGAQRDEPPRGGNKGDGRGRHRNSDDDRR